jgi:hypothetical protein
VGLGVGEVEVDAVAEPEVDSGVVEEDGVTTEVEVTVDSVAELLVAVKMDVSEPEKVVAMLLPTTTGTEEALVGTSVTDVEVVAETAEAPVTGVLGVAGATGVVAGVCAEAEEELMVVTVGVAGWTTMEVFEVPGTAVTVVDSELGQ